MSRVLLQYVVPLVLPAAIYVLWVALSRRRGRDPALPRSLEKGPLFWLVVLGFVLATASLVWFGLERAEETGGAYQPPRYEDGRIVPGGVKP
jgi:hypothetical protein